MKKLYITLILLAFIKVSNAQESKIIGNWKLSKEVENGITQRGFSTVYYFMQKGVLKIARNTSQNPKIVGSWKFNPSTKELTLKSKVDWDYNGRATIIELTENNLSYNKDGLVFMFNKLKKPNNSAKIKLVTATKPVLSFKEEAMLDADGSFSYEDEDKLPWKIDDIVNYLKNYKDVVYTVTHFPNNYKPNSFLVSSRINYNKAKKTIDVREYSLIKNDYIKVDQNPIPIDNLQDYEDDFHFFPKDNLNIYKVIGTENVKTVLGNFNCTVVEGFGDFDLKIKYWMINNKPGVYAKIIKIKQAPGSFGYTNLYTLKEIK